MEQDFIARTALDEMVESDRNQMLKGYDPLSSAIRSAVSVHVCQNPGAY